MTTSTVTDMSLSQNGSSKQTVNGGSGRRKTKGSQLTQKKNRLPQRGLGVAQLERIRKQTESAEIAPNVSNFDFPAVTFPTSGCTSLQNVAVHFRHVPTPAMVVHGVGIHGSNLYRTDHVTGSSNGGFRFENSNSSSKEFSSISNYMRCVSDGCGVCYKKKRISDGINHCLVNPNRNFSGSNTVVEMIDVSKTRRSSSQVTEAMLVHRNGGGLMTEYEFFPGKVNGVNGAEEYKEWMSMGSTAAWCGSGTSFAGTLGLRGGEGSCVTAINGGEEGSVSSLDLSLKLSY